MKSVSFSDLRNSTDMSSIRTDYSPNGGDSIIKRSSSYKNLTYYSSSEDILKRFSSKTTELKSFRNVVKSENRNSENHSIPPEEIPIEKQDEKSIDCKTTAPESTVQGLRSIISEHEKTISKLQEENLILQNASSKNIEEIKFQENRIKYLEHMIAAFNTNVHESTKTNSQTNEEYPFNEGPCKNENLPREGTQNKSIFLGINSKENIKSSNAAFTKNVINNNDILANLNARPSSADSTLYNDYKFVKDLSDKDKPNRSLYSTMRTYTSDSDDRHNSGSRHNVDQYEKISTADLVSGQRQKLEKDRSANLSDLKNRLEEFTIYAKRSAEQNSLSQHSSTVPSRKNERSASNSDCYSDPQFKGRPRVMNSSGDARPPIDPYYKQRRCLQTDVRQMQDRPAYPSTTKAHDLMENEDENLKERVQKILEKNKISTMGYTNDNRKTSDYNLKSNGDYNRLGSTEVSNIRRADRNPAELRYSYQSKDFLSANESNIPRLDLTLYNPSSDELIAKYLNYQGSTNVS